jgi:hypothetical protein
MGACLLAAIGLLSAQEVSGSLALHRLRCEYLENHLGIDVVVPRLSWELQAVDPQARGCGRGVTVCWLPARATNWTVMKEISGAAAKDKPFGPAEEEIVLE